MRHAMCKPRNMTFKRFAAQLTDINNFVIILTGPYDTNKMPTE